ncbi:MAG: RidA family protein [Myxococcota bacterium]
MPHTMTNPADLHDPTPWGYAHTASVPAGTELVFISGQYASDEEGRVTSPDFAAQVERTLDNVRRALAAHDLEPAHVVQLRTYVVDHDVEKLGAITAAVAAMWPGKPPTQTLIGVARLATPEVLFEVEAVAARP